MSLKTIGYILIGGILVVLIMIGYLLWGGKPAPDKITIKDRAGNSLKVNDYLKTATDVSDSAVTIEQGTGPASYYYNKNGNLYTIVLNEANLADFNAKKPQAEQDFLNKLGITEAEACRLNVVVINGGSKDEDLQGKEFPLSFCNQ